MKVLLAITREIDDLGRLDVDEVTRKIELHFPECELLWEDYYAQERLEKLAAFEELERRGASVQKLKKRFLSDLAAKRIHEGVARGLRIPCAGGNMIAVVREKEVRFYVSEHFDSDTTAKFRSLFNELGLQWDMGPGHVPKSWSSILGGLDEWGESNCF